MKTIIHEAGIAELFSAHSVRGAAATATHMKGMAVSDILKIAEWSLDHAFKAFSFIGQQREAWEILTEHFYQEINPVSYILCDYMLVRWP